MEDNWKTTSEAARNYWGTKPGSKLRVAGQLQASPASCRWMRHLPPWPYGRSGKQLGENRESASGTNWETIGKPHLQHKLETT